MTEPHVPGAPGVAAPPFPPDMSKPAGPPAGAAPAGRASVSMPGQVPGQAGVRGVTGTFPTVARVQVGEAVRAARQTVTAAASRGPRRARLQLKKIDPWSAMKFSFAVSLVLFIASVVATALLYMVLGAVGVWSSVNETVDQVLSGQGQFAITAKLVIGGSALLGAVNVVLFTALCTLGSFIYNVCADLVGGIELTLAEKD